MATRRRGKLKIKRKSYAEIGAEKERESKQGKSSDRHLSTNPNAIQKIKPHDRYTGQMSLEKHHALLKKDAMLSLRISINRAETKGSRTPTKYNAKWSHVG